MGIYTLIRTSFPLSEVGEHVIRFMVDQEQSDQPYDYELLRSGLTELMNQGRLCLEQLDDIVSYFVEAEHHPFCFMGWNSYWSGTFDKTLFSKSVFFVKDGIVHINSSCKNYNDNYHRFKTLLIPNIAADGFYKVIEQYGEWPYEYHYEDRPFLLTVDEIVGIGGQPAKPFDLLKYEQPGDSPFKTTLLGEIIPIPDCSQEGIEKLLMEQEGKWAKLMPIR